MTTAIFNFSGNNYAIKIRHYTPKNSSKSERKGKQWMTVAELWSLDENGRYLECIRHACSYCSDKDQPSRAVGRAVALGRLKKQTLNFTLF
jgi:hypothetical protein